MPDADAIAGTMDNVPFHVYAMKDNGYVSMFMSTYNIRHVRMGKSQGNPITQSYQKLNTASFLPATRGVFKPL